LARNSPEGQDVVDRFFAQEVVDAEHLRLVEDLVHRLVQCPGRVQVGTERLLDDHTGVPRQAGRTQEANDRGERGWWHGQVIKAPNGPDDCCSACRSRPARSPRPGQ
jgi:hypothetical protein